VAVKYLLQTKTVRYYQFKKFLRDSGDKVFVDALDAIDRYRDGTTINRRKIVKEIYSKYLDPESETEENPPSYDAAALCQDANGDVARNEGKDKDPNKVAKDEMDERRKLFALRKVIRDAGFQEGLGRIQKKLNAETPPPQLFKTFRNLLARLLEDRLTLFAKSEYYHTLIQLEDYASKPPTLKSLRTFRVLGRGAFGSVSAVQKIDTHAIYAMKEMNKKQIKQNHSEWMVIIEKKSIS